MEKDTFTIDNKVLLIGGSLLLLAGIGTFWYIKKKKNKEQTTTQSKVLASGGFCKYGDDYPLKHGSCGNRVKTLQKKLKALGADLGTTGENRNGIDGKYGDKTQAAVQRFLKKTTISSTDAQRLKLR